MLTGLLSGVFGTRHERERKRIQPIVDEINEQYARLQSVSEESCAARPRSSARASPSARASSRRASPS